MPTHDPNEAITRQFLIDPALSKAGWNVNDTNSVGREIPADGFDLVAWAALRARLRDAEARPLDPINLPSGICDYALYRSNGHVLAVVEAKRTSTDPQLAQAQAEFYVEEIARRQPFKPFAFLANGLDTFFLDAGATPKRQVTGFFSADDLERLLYLREHKLPLSDTPINTRITDRAYQQEAVRRVCETFDAGQRRALLVMATGTGKTRTAMSLVDVLLRSNQARKILFVADRDPLVKQALEDGFAKHLADEPASRIYTGKIDKTKRLYVATLQTMSVCYTEFTPAFFDVIIFDEVHRSIFNKWNDVLHYFDARVIGLTATPADFIDRNTFREFGCDEGIPTFSYSYRQAIGEHYLVDYSLYKAQTRFQRGGIHGVDLSEEDRNQLIAQGIDPDEIDYDGSELERSVSNTDTLRRQWQEIWDISLKDESGQLPGKTIIFALSQNHALRLAAVFDQMFPQFRDLVRVITYKSDYKDTLLEKFKREDQPRIAITVDLLETGVDVPEVVNLVFMKPVQSRIKLEQMIGRGTRPNAACHFRDRLPDGCKKEFLVIDFWENNFNKPPEEELAQSLPVLVSLFNTRLKILEAVLPNTATNLQAREVLDQTLLALRAQIAEVPTDTYAVKQVMPEIEPAWQDSFWGYITRDKIEFLRLRVAPLMRYVPGADVQAETFVHKLERLKLQQLTSRDTAATAESIAEDAARLMHMMNDSPDIEMAVQTCLSPALRAAPPAQLDRIAQTLGPQMRNRSTRPNPFITLDLPDYIAAQGYILLRGGTERVFVEEYRRRVEDRILSMVDSHPTLQAISRGEAVSDAQLLDLERALRQELAEGDVELTESNVRKAFGMRISSLLEFLRRLLDLPNVPDYSVIVGHQFESFIGAQNFNADQIRFLRAVQTLFVQKRRLHLADLYAPPLTNFGQDAVDRLFKPDQVHALLVLAEQLAV